MSRFQKQSGFTLISVMVVVAIIAILAAIAYPSYMKYVQKSRRQQAISVMHMIQLAQEKYRANNPQYTNLAELYDAGLLPAQMKHRPGETDAYETENGYYTLVIENAGASSYMIVATAKEGTSQASDAGCTPLKMNQDQPVYDANNRHCWGR